MPDESGREIRIDFKAIRSIGDKGWLRAAAFIAFGESAWKNVNIDSLNIAGEFAYHFFPEPLPDKLADQVRAEFRRWVIVNGLLEIEQGLALFLDQTYEAALLAALHGKRVPRDAQRRVNNFRSDTNIASKLGKLRDEFGLDCQILAKHAEGWACARNSLHHARGVVRQRDCNVDSTLVVSWTEPTLQDEDGKPIEYGVVLEKDTKAAIAFPTKQRIFRIGQTIDLTEKEMLHLCFTAHLGIVGCLKVLEELVQSAIKNSEKPDAEPSI
jgi:hypothetical protein